MSVNMVGVAHGGLFARPARERSRAKKCLSSDVLRAGAAAIGSVLEVDADGVAVDGHRFASLEAANDYLDERALAMGQPFLFQVAKEDAEYAALERRRAAALAAQERVTFGSGTLQLPPELL